MENLENNILDGGDMVQYVHAMLEEGVLSKNILVNKYWWPSLTTMIDKKHYMDQFITFHKMNLEELCIIIQNIMPINENEVNWGIARVKVALNFHHLWVPWPQVVVCFRWSLDTTMFNDIGKGKGNVVNMIVIIPTALWHRDYMSSLFLYCWNM